MAKLAIDKTIETGCALDASKVILVESLDALADDRDTVITYVGSYFRDDQAEPWATRPYPHHKLVSCCSWASAQLTEELRCVLSDEGYVRLYGPGGKPSVELQVPDAGVWRQGAAGYGYVSRIRAIGQGLYVCGDARQIYRLLYPSNANDVEALLKRARFVHMDAGMLQPPKPEAPNPADAAAMAQWLDATDTCQFWDIGGSSESDIYAVGHETWHWNGASWRQLELPNDGETVQVIKVVDASTVILAGSNGYVMLGNAERGFANLSGVDDNQTFTGVEVFDDRIWLATDHGLYTWSADTRVIARYTTTLAVDLVDAHVLEARDGVLWSIGRKDIAYLEVRDGEHVWTRVHHPDNPRVDQTAARPARSSVRQDQAAAVAAAVAQETSPSMAWLPAAVPGQIDVGGLISRVGHAGVGPFVLAQLAPLGLKPSQVLQTQDDKRYTVTVPGQGLELTLKYLGRSPLADRKSGQPWGLAEVRLLTTLAAPQGAWSGPWPGGLDPASPRLLDDARALLGPEAIASGNQVSFYADGPLGADWVINLEFDPRVHRLRFLRVANLGGFIAP